MAKGKGRSKVLPIILAILAVAVVAANIAAVMFDSTLDKYAPGGGYVWAVGLMRSVGREENSDRKNKIIFDEVYKYGSTFYKK